MVVLTVLDVVAETAIVTAYRKVEMMAVERVEKSAEHWDVNLVAM